MRALLALDPDDHTWVDVDDDTLTRFAHRYTAEMAQTVSVRSGMDVIPARIMHDGTRYGLRLARPATVFTLELIEDGS